MSLVIPEDSGSGAPAPARPAAGNRSWRGALLALERRTTSVAAFVACLMMSIAVSAGLWQVVVRFLFNAPSEWSEVLTRFALIWMVYLGVPVAIRQGAMVSIDLMHRLLRGQLRMVLEIFVVSATVALMLVMLWFGAQVTWRVRFQEIAGLYVPISWAYLAIPIGAAFSILAVLAHFFDPKRRELETAV